MLGATQQRGGATYSMRVATTNPGSVPAGASDLAAAAAMSEFPATDTSTRSPTPRMGTTPPMRARAAAAWQTSFVVTASPVESLVHSPTAASRMCLGTR